MNTSSGSPHSGCCKPSRRDFLRTSGLGLAAWLSPQLYAGPFTAEANSGLGLDANHPVPLDKKLSAAWIASLTARGQPSRWADWRALQHIGMPVAGIGTGTVYLGGDGRLWGWDIFNVPHEGAVPGTVPGKRERDGANYLQPSRMESPWNLSQGLVLHADGQARRLDHTGFSQVQFTGQYPIGRVELSDPQTPISAVIEAYSPFIPLDYDNSSLPVTVMEVTLRNSTDRVLAVELEALLENAGIRYDPTTRTSRLRRLAQAMPLETGAMVMGGIRAAPENAASLRPEILLQDFETDTWERIGWVATGEAFGSGPIQGTIRAVTGFQGKAYAHSHNIRQAKTTPPDNLTGTLLSPVFRAERRFLSFLVVGGNRPADLAVELLQGDQVVHSVTGTGSNTFTRCLIDLASWQNQDLRLRLTDRATGAWGSIGIDRVVLTDSDEPGQPLESLRDRGSLAVAMLAAGAVAQPVRGRTGKSAEAALTEAQEMAVRAALQVPAHGEVKTTVLFAWHFPQVHPAMGKLPDPRRWVAERFADAAAVASYVARELPRLGSQTRAFRDTWYGAETGPNRGTLPHWLLERALWPVSALTTNGTYRLSGGRIWGWEGTGCCAGTCTHVWHYGQAAGRLFPQLEIDLRERTDFTPAAMTPAGLIRFRGSYSAVDHACIDGQAGILLRCYREHLTDPTGEFLRRNWPHIRQATEFLVQSEAKGKPGGNNGVFTARFENTLDAKWGGEIPWIVGMYLAGLTAAAAMADQAGDPSAAARWRAIVAQGRAAYAGYFDPQQGFYQAKCTAEDLLPVHVGPGSHIDMCLGDFWLAQVGLPPLGQPDHLRRAMDSLFKYNFVPDMGLFRERTKPHAGRTYALAGEGGLVMATWPYGGLPEACKSAWQFGYFQECMSGFEHAAAALMVALARDDGDPLLTQGLAVCRAVHDRYDAVRRNPYNEIECSDHYARAMASYGVFIAATGFHCDASAALWRFEPKIGANDFAGPFIGAGAWGRFTQRATATGRAVEVEVRYGSMRLARLELAARGGIGASSTVMVAGRPMSHTLEEREGRLAIVLNSPVVLVAGQSLTVAV